jgi:hypothetical protein
MGDVVYSYAVEVRVTPPACGRRDGLQLPAKPCLAWVELTTAANGPFCSPQDRESLSTPPWYSELRGTPIGR